MAAKKKPATKRKTSTKSKTATKNTAAKAKKTASRKAASPARVTEKTSHSRTYSIVLFAVAAFVFLLTYVSGSAFWQSMHLGVRGLFGCSVFLLAPMILYIAVICALDKSQNIVLAKVIESVILMLLISALFHAIMIGLPTPINSSFFRKLSSLYNSGIALKGGGIFGAILGWPLYALLNKVGSIIVIALLIIVFLMLLTNKTIVDLFRGVSKPIKTGYIAVKEDNAQRIRNSEHKRAMELEEHNKNARVDIAKYLDADSKPKSRKKPEERAMPDKFFDPDPTDFIDMDQNANKTKKNRKPAQKPNKTGAVKAKDLQEIVRKALPDEKPVKEKAEKEERAEIYVENDGQTTFFDNGNHKSAYSFPPITLLKLPNKKGDIASYKQELANRSETLVDTLRSFGVQTRIVDIHRGPSVTRYELQPAAGVKVSKITGLADDIALNLAAEGIRIEAPIPGKAAVGIEIANEKRDSVSIRELIDSDEFRNSKGKLSFAVGKDIEGNIVMGDISKMPHMLVAGTTGAGKSVFTNSIIMNILYKAAPDEVKLILIDPKQVEFPIYNGIPHLLIPVVTDARKAAGALGWAVSEMLKRYKKFADNGVRDLEDYNEYVKDKEDMEPMPQIVVVIDELADLMMAAPKEVEDSICRIAQLARAAGMHLIIATQSPRVDVVTGLIKANIPSRVALKVSNNTDSRVILDEGGAEKLLGKGDLLYKPVGLGKPMRIQGSFVPTSEVRAVVNFLKNQSKAEYSDTIIEEIDSHVPQQKGEKKGSSDLAPENSDDKLEEAIKIIVENQTASTSFLQRKLSLGYARAARIMDELEQMGIIGPSNGSKPREILMSKEQWLERNVMSNDEVEMDI